MKVTQVVARLRMGKRESREARETVKDKEAIFLNKLISKLKYISIYTSNQQV